MRDFDYHKTTQILRKYEDLKLFFGCDMRSWDAVRLILFQNLNRAKKYFNKKNSKQLKETILDSCALVRAFKGSLDRRVVEFFSGVLTGKKGVCFKKFKKWRKLISKSEYGLDFNIRDEARNAVYIASQKSLKELKISGEISPKTRRRLRVLLHYFGDILEGKKIAKICKKLLKKIDKPGYNPAKPLKKLNKTTAQWRRR